VTVDNLSGRSGDVRTLLGRAEPGILDLSNLAEWGRREVFDGLHFTRISLAKVEIALDCVNCSFTESSFVDIRATRCFWAANDIWKACRFQRVNFKEMISPMNTFRDCRFEELKLVNYKPYQTLFENCTFSESKIEGMRARTIFNRSNVNLQLHPADPAKSVVFRRCTFENTKFNKSYFNGVAFEGCRFHSTTADQCDFTGVQSDVTWWDTQKGDPFTAFLTEALEFIGTRCGRNSRAYEVFERYVIEYGTGKTTSQDFSACLYSNNVPDDQLERIEQKLPELLAKFPF
jgi:uncharacterized protein YjbI with pentapeptide repeats